MTNLIPMSASSSSNVSILATPTLRKKEVISNTPNATDEETNKQTKNSILDSFNENQSRGDVSDVPKENISQIFQFQRRQKRGGTIDVWWLYDDGGK